MINSKFAIKMYNEIIDTNNLSVSMDYDSPIGTGNTSSFDNNLDLCTVGIDKLVKQSEISDYDFMAGLVAIHHENRHAEQIHDVHYNQEESSNLLKYSYYAGHTDSSYVAENYFISPREIEAEFYGMYFAHKNCVNYFGTNRADELLCNYVNTKVKNDISFVHKYYDNVDDIFTDMSKAYANSVYKQREIMQSTKDFLHNSPYILQKLEHEKIGYKQDRMMASLYLGQTRNKYLHHLPGLSKIDWSHETNFSVSESIVDRVKEHMHIRKSRGDMADELFQRIQDNSSENKQIDIDY